MLTCDLHRSRAEATIQLLKREHRPGRGPRAEGAPTSQQSERSARPDLALQDVRKRFGTVEAVAGISIEVRHGEFYSLLGPSGCGKTTTLRLVAGFERPDAGRVLIAGQDVTALPPHLRGTNTVFQHYALFPHMTVEQNVAYGLRQKRLPRQQVADRLERGLATVRLADLRRRKPRELSGGQQQRVALARALVNEPTVLLLDEPLAALDQKLRKAMHGELKVLQERVGITFVYVTHDQEEALTLSDRIAVMNQGTILQEGTPQEIYERPTTRFVADFIGLTNFFEGEVVEAGPTTVVRDGSGHVLRCAGVPWASPGMRVSVGVRPENLDIANGDASAQAGANRVGGTVTRRTYLGDLVQYRVMLRGGQEVLCQVQNARGEGAECGPGDAVELAWEERHALVLAEERSDPAQHEDVRLVNEETPRPSRPWQEQPTA